jgi:hypothetical protein
MSNSPIRNALDQEVNALNRLNGYADIEFQAVWLPDGLKWLPANSHVVLGTIADDQVDIVLVFTTESAQDAVELANKLKTSWAEVLWVEGGLDAYEPEDGDEDEDEDEEEDGEE